MQRKSNYQIIHERGAEKSTIDGVYVVHTSGAR